MHEQPAVVQPSGSFWTSREFALYSLVGANAVTIIFFALQGGSIIQVLWIYWLQSVIIGIVNIVRIMRLNFSENNPATGQPEKVGFVASGGIAKLFFSAFFTIHYGGFHFGYMVALIVFSMESTVTVNGAESELALGTVSLAAVLLSGLGFAIHHVMSYVDEARFMRRNPQAAAASVGRAMVQPYLRIVPMHLIIIFGPFISVAVGNAWVFTVFIVLKSVFDVRLYQSGISHKAAMPTTTTVSPTPV